MPTFVIKFDDGSTVTKSADTADLAKAAAKLERAKELGSPARTDPRFKVAAVLRQDKPTQPIAPPATPGAPPPPASGGATPPARPPGPEIAPLPTTPGSTPPQQPGAPVPPEER